MRALEEPLRIIAANSGEEGSVVLNKVLDGQAATGQRPDRGVRRPRAVVIDPTKAVRFALQNASSVAGLMLTTDAMVAELVEEKGRAGGHSHGMPGMGGMGGMGDMDM